MTGDEHIVHRNGVTGNEFLCEACGATKGVRFPASVSMFVSVINEFIASHRDCGFPCDHCHIRTREDYLASCSHCDQALCIDCGQPTDHQCTIQDEEP